MLTAGVWLMALLGQVQGWGLSPAADDNAAPDLQCSRCFHGQTFPQWEGLAPSPLCHRTPGGRDFATLRRLDCETAVASALRLGPGWMQGQEGEELVEIEADGVKVFIPALLRGGEHASPATDSPLQRWDWAVSTLVRSSVAPECSALGGELYVLTGAGAPGDEGCQAGPLLWSAACCSVPEAEGDFSVGLIRETGNDDVNEKRVSVKELQERLGVEELFSGGCAAAGGESTGVALSLHTEDTRELAADEIGLDSKIDDESDSDTSEADASDADGSDPDESEAFARDAEADVTEESAVKTESSSTEEADETRSVETVPEQEDEADSNSSSIVVSIFSTTLSILKAPLRPFFSRITQFPRQVTYVLREELGVLAALPGDSFSLFYLLTSDLLSWMRWAAETLLDILMNCVYSLYYCASSMLAELLNSCFTGVTGVGTLAGDTVGIFGDALGNTWWVSKFFGGRLLKQSGDYAGTVAMEMGDQALALGGGTGWLAWRSLAGVFNMFIMGGNIIIGVVDVVFGAFKEGFGQEKEMKPVHTVLSETE
ncbi:uncharacterized protein LOC133401395 isoform X2 [Phycodurus eques]|uniref:uncharacterized protein LOC133401395 isoform X2 n=1 Tax=Phycodurus eques TaxID=693459 RepID=UPI002ACE9C31|nr:uncharacterized protein LOC133401395 isoform X2 [Phycodurus eques]